MRLLMWLMVLFALLVLAGLIGRCDMHHAQPRSACRMPPQRCIDFDNVEPARFVLWTALGHKLGVGSDALSAKETAS